MTTRHKAYSQGLDCGAQDGDRDSNPYDEEDDPEGREAWDDGWRQGQALLRDEEEEDDDGD